MMKFTAPGAVALAFALAGPASALSCMPPDIVRSYKYAKEQESLYFLFKGSIDLVKEQSMPTERDASVYGVAGETLLEPVYGSFKGEIFHEGAFVPYEATIEVRLNCLGEWCGSYPDTKEALYFVSAAESNLWFTLSMPPCGGTLFPVKEADALVAYLEAQGTEWGEPDSVDTHEDANTSEDVSQ